MSSLPPPSWGPPGAATPPPAPPPAPPYAAPQPGFGTCWPTSGPVQYAGFWSRVGSRLLDSLVGLAIMSPFLVGGIILLANGLDCYRVDSSRRRGTNIHCVSTNGGTAFAGFVVLFAGLILWIVLYIRWWARGQTPGMKAVGNRLVRTGTLQPIGVGRATGRFFASFLSGWFFDLGYFWMIWDKQKRTWHDMMCETIVIKA